MYGNVGTDERLDFTVIGRAVNEAARLQGLTKQLGHPVLASASFVEPILERFDFAGAHAVAGFDDMLDLYPTHLTHSAPISRMVGAHRSAIRSPKKPRRWRGCYVMKRGYAVS